MASGRFVPLSSPDQALEVFGILAGVGFADPDAGIGYGYVTSQMGTTLPRDVAFRDALHASISERRPRAESGQYRSDQGQTR